MTCGGGTINNGLYVFIYKLELIKSMIGFKKFSGRATDVASAVVVSVLLFTFVAQAASTISTNISTGGTLAVTGASTLTGALYATSTAVVTGDILTYANGTFGDSATADQYIFAGGLQASSTALMGGGFRTYGNWTIDQAATTTVAISQAGINFDSNTFVIDPNSDRIGILTSTPKTALEIVGTASTSALISSGAINASTTLGVTGTATFFGTASSSNVIASVTLGVATTTPSATLGVLGSGYFTLGLGVGQLNTTAGTIIASSNIGVATATPASALGVVGTTTISAGILVGAATTGNSISAIMMGTCTYNPGASITASTTLSTNCTGATGVRSGDRVFVTPRDLANYLVMTSASSTATNDVVQVSVYNMGWGGPLTPASATWSWMALR